MRVSSALHFWQGWYVIYPTTRPGVESVLSLFSSNYLIHDAGTILSMAAKHRDFLGNITLKWNGEAEIPKLEASEQDV